MKLFLIHRPSVPASASPYRLRDEGGRELDGVNAFLDGQRLRQLSLRSLRTYAYDLLDFARWFEPQRRPLAEISESTLVDYVRYQLDQDRTTAQTVNHRLGVVRCWYRFHTGRDVPTGQVHFQRAYIKRSPLGYGRPRRAIALGLRLKQDHRVIVPLSAEEVAQFWQSFRTYRDLALVGLMLLDGLRSCEVLGLQLQDLQLADGQMHVRGKGNKKRVVPLPPDILEVLGNYLRQGPHHADLPGIRQALAATRHFLEMYRRQLDDEQAKRKLQRLDRRLLAVASQLEQMATAEK